MDGTTFQAFGDELVKIAFFQKVRNGFVGAMREGWHGTPGNEATWFGKGREIRPGMGRGARMWDEFSSLGGATKALPVGAKSMMAVGTGLMARDALRPVDPSGRNRSRLERVGGLAANTLGGLAGSALGNRIRPGVLGSMAGGLIGGTIAEKAVTAPFSLVRRTMPQPQSKNQYVQQPDGGAQV